MEKRTVPGGKSGRPPNNGVLRKEGRNRSFVKGERGPGRRGDSCLRREEKGFLMGKEGEKVAD